MDGIAALALSTEQQYMYPKQIKILQLSSVIFGVLGQTSERQTSEWTNVRVETSE